MDLSDNISIKKENELFLNTSIMSDRSRPTNESGLLSLSSTTTTTTTTTTGADFDKLSSAGVDAFYTGDADLMVMDNLVRDVRNFRDALNQLSCVLNSAAITSRKCVFNQGTLITCA